MRATFWVLVAAFVAIGITAVSLAKDYPWVRMGSDDIRYFESAELDQVLRIEMIKQASSDIDIANYDVRANPFTFPILQALREAADRGVRVRFLVSWTPQLVFDPTSAIPKYLLDPPTRTPIEYMIFGGPHVKRIKMGMTDGMHEKLMIFDSAHALVTGRGFGDIYLKWLDTTFAVKGPLVAQAQSGFEDLWKTVRSLGRGPYKIGLGSNLTPLKRYSSETSSLLAKLSESDRAGFADLHGWFAIPSAIDPAAEPAVGRLLHFDFIRQSTYVMDPVGISNEKRLEYLNDPIVNAVIESVRGARRIHLTTPSFTLHPLLRDALLRERVIQLCGDILTNGPWREGRGLDTLPLWAFGLPELERFMRAGFTAYAFRVNPRDPWVLLHRKLAIIDDDVFVGSHNFNFPSSTANDEMSFQIRSPSFAREMRGLYHETLLRNAELLAPGMVHEERLKTEFIRKLLDPMRNIL